MSSLLQRLEEKINSAIELIELQKIQIEELAIANNSLQNEHIAIKNRHQLWEQSLNNMLAKLEGTDLALTIELPKSMLVKPEEALA